MGELSVLDDRPRSDRTSCQVRTRRSRQESCSACLLRLCHVAILWLTLVSVQSK